jgi:hypothetical protein
MCRLLLTSAFAGAIAVVPCHSAAQTRDQLITSHRIAGITMCDPLSRVDSAFRQVRDTLIVGEDDETGWASKIVVLAPDEWILFESSWVDSLRVWRASTNSPRFRTRRQLRVGRSMGDVLATRDSLDFQYPEGYLLITLVPEDISFQVDDSSATAFWRRFQYQGSPLDALSRSARIKEFTIGGDCR